VQDKKFMKAAMERKIIRWIHIIASIPIIGYIYGPVKNFPQAVSAIQWILFPLIVLSGLWLWKGHWIRKWSRKRNVSDLIVKNEKIIAVKKDKFAGL
jgi:hypothetical protein